MQHLQGETLAERLRRGLLPVHEAVAHAIQIAGAIELFDAPWALRVTGAGRPQYDVTPEGGRQEAGGGGATVAARSRDQRTPYGAAAVAAAPGRRHQVDHRGRRSP